MGYRSSESYTYNPQAAVRATSITGGRKVAAGVPEDVTTIAPTTERGELSVASRIVEAIAEHTGTDAFSLEPPLYYSIDVDALERLFRGSDGVVTFEYEGHRVAVDSDGAVTVDGVTYEDR